MQPGLTIYRSSAGSGKTYTLVRNYLLLAFAHQQSYRHILAVTFTHKATREMKLRVIETIRGIANNEDIPVVDEIADAYNLSEYQVRQRARQILEELLHNYSYFTITTIDSFFYRVIRSFAREAGLQGNFNIELDQDKVLEDVIDQMMASLQKGSQLNSWLVRFAREQIFEGKSWDVRKDISRLAGELFQESYQTLPHNQTSRTEEKKLLDHLSEQINSFEEPLKQMGRKALKIADKYGLQVDDFHYKSGGFFNFFQKPLTGLFERPGARVHSALENPEKWARKGSDKDQVNAARDDGMYQLLKEMVDLFEQGYHNYVSHKLILENFYVFGIFNYLAEEVSAYRAENEIMLISDLNFFLQQVIEGNPTPFIYEKVGNRFDHYLLDEFQDTSGLQWSNFLPLIRNSMDAGKSNLIVGDVKQAIYRWRGGEVGLLLDHLEKKFSPQQLHFEPLKTNWRSAPEVVNFNNRFFSVASGLITEHVREAYRDTIGQVYQHVHQGIADKNRNKDGLISFRFLPDNKENSFREGSIEQLIASIWDCHRQGFSPSDIVILVRTNGEGADIARNLMEYRNGLSESDKGKFNVISSEALFLDQAVSVRIILNLFRFMTNPKDELALANLIFDYQSGVLGRKTDQIEFGLVVAGKMKSRLYEFLPLDLNEGIQSLYALTLFELGEEIIRAFNLRKVVGEINYILAFQEEVLKYMTSHGSDLGEFLDWWDISGTKKTIPIPEGQDAISIYTIHKAKGLEFPVVLMPFVNWKLDHQSSGSRQLYLWADTTPHPSDYDRILPVRYKQDLAESWFSNLYYEEKALSYLDNLNLLYVALTRAEQVLIAHLPEPSSGKMDTVAALAYQTLQREFKDEWETANGEELLVLGKWPVKEGASISNITMTPIESYHSLQWTNRITIKRNTISLQKGKRTAATYGTLIHSLLAEIRYSSDIRQVLQSAVREGAIEKEEEAEIATLLADILSTGDRYGWFDEKADIVNEHPVILKEGEIIRMDRVVINEHVVQLIDYKTGEKAAKYIHQMKKYMDALRDLFPGQTVLGFVYYIDKKLIEEVK